MLPASLPSLFHTEQSAAEKMLPRVQKRIQKRVQEFKTPLSDTQDDSIKLSKYNYIIVCVQMPAATLPNTTTAGDCHSSPTWPIMCRVGR